MRTDAAQMREKEDEIRSWLESNQDFAERYSKQQEAMRAALEQQLAGQEGGTESQSDS